MHTRIARRVPLYCLERIDDRLLLYHPGLTRTVYLNETASLIWGLCDGQRSNLDITELLRETYPDEAAHIADDVEATLQRLQVEGALEFA